MYDGVRESDEYPEDPPSYPKIGYYNSHHHNNNNLPGPFDYQEPTTTTTNGPKKEVNVSKIILRDKYPPFQEKIFKIQPK